MKSKIICSVTILAILASSCTTTEKFTINTEAGTKVTLPASLKGEISTVKSGDKKVEIPSDCYLGYVNLQPEGLDMTVPMGINYKTKKRSGAKLASGTGMTLMTFGSVLLLSGAVALAMDNENTNTLGVGAGLAGAGAAVAGLGAGVGLSSMQRLKQTSYDYNFTYDAKQTLTLPKMSKTLLNPNAPKPAANSNTSTKVRKQAKSGITSDAKVISGPTASKKKNDYAKHITGQYDGNGELLLRGNVDEVYEQINLIMERIDNGHVSVQILVDGESFFDAPLIYTVQPDGNGYLLKNDDVPEATITVNDSSKVSFHHPRVVIDGDVYVLKVSAKR